MTADKVTARIAWLEQQLMKLQPLSVTLLEQRAKANASGIQTGRAEEDGVRCHYHPRSKTWTFWIFSVKRPKAAVVEHFRFQEVFKKQA